MTYGKNINTYEKSSFSLLVTKYTSMPVFEPTLFSFPTIMEEVSSLLMKATLLGCNPAHDLILQIILPFLIHWFARQ